MNITPKDTTNIKKRMYGMPATQTSSPLSASTKYRREPLKLNPKNLSFEGSSANNLSTLMNDLGQRFGHSTQQYWEKQIIALNSGKKSMLALSGGKITFKQETFAGRINQAIIDPVVHLPLDLTNSTLNLLKRIPRFKNSKLINNLLKADVLKNRSDYVEGVSNTAAIQHYIEMLENDALKSKIFTQGHKRLNAAIANYSTKAERSMTRFVTGIIPAFFLANDAYNLSIYVNNNKDLAQKEKKKRFMQEVSRITITAAATFAFLSYFAKKSNSHHDTATMLISVLTFASEIIGRTLVGVPFYPISEKTAQKYAKLKYKDKLGKEENAPQNANSTSNGNNINKIEFDKPQKNSIKINKKEDSKSINILNILGGLVIFGFAVEQLTKKGTTMGNRLEKIAKAHKARFKEDIFMPKKEIDGLILKLRENGFDKLAENYEQILSKLPTAKDNNGMIKIGTHTNKSKDIIVNEFLALPLKFVWEVLMIPYKGVVKPLFELSKQILGSLRIINIKPKVSKNYASKEEEIFKDGIRFLKKISKDKDFKDKLNKSLISSFDNINKSNFSNAELSGAAKTAVSTVTSGFLIADNYNLVMIDSQGKDKDLAKQKAKERTLQRIARIAYGATLIKLSNGIFKVPFNNSLLEAQAVNILTTGVIETLERKSVGLPLSESTREDIIENDENNTNAKGLKGSYYRFMSQLTGKKSLAEMKTDKK